MQQQQQEQQVEEKGTIESSDEGKLVPISGLPPSIFDPLSLICPHDPSHLFSARIRGFSVGRIACRYPGAVHFNEDRLSYMFHHPVEEMQMLIELPYTSMIQPRLILHSATSATHGQRSTNSNTATPALPIHPPATLSFFVDAPFHGFDHLDESDWYVSRYAIKIGIDAKPDADRLAQLIMPTIRNQQQAMRR